ncbi:MAG TPA: hypothetical protein PL182_07475 [Pseudobdellovibrionaceae bacterium]|nr:hypothetical protein [Pseudobdellovibrionaceae bacterium]
MKIQSMIPVVLMVLSLGFSAWAQTAADCNKPLSENSNANIVCNTDDKNLAKKPTGAPEATVPEVENPGGCRECYANRYDKRLKEGNTVAPASTGGGTDGGGETGTNSKTRK